MTPIRRPAPSIAEGREATEPNPAQLLKSARSGDAAAFEALYRRHVGPVHGVCLRLTADPERAEELTQEVFARAFTTLGKFRGASALGTWLHRMAVNTVFGDWRSRQRRERHLVVVDDLANLAAAAVAAAAPEGTDLDLERAIAALPPRARAVFVLHDIEGYAHQEIAEMTDMALGTSKAHLHRARRLLRETLRR